MFNNSYIKLKKCPIQNLLIISNKVFFFFLNQIKFYFIGNKIILKGFFFPQAFITGTLQNYARKHEIAIDALSFEYKIQDQTSYNTIKQKPEDGCYIYGIFLEGARWDSEKHILSDSKPKELFSDLPLVWLFPCVNRQPPVDGIYDCPIYKVDSRAGTLSTTGHSTNFVMYIELSSDREQDIWIKAGVACFLALRY